MNFAHRLATAALTMLAAALAFGDANATHTGVVKSARIEMRFRPNSWAAASVDRTLAAAERDLDRIGAALAWKPAGPFTVFVYDDASELAAITGTTGMGGFSTLGESHIPYANDQTRLHELVHLVAATLPKAGDEPRNLFFAEGLANAVLEYVDGVHVHAVAAFYLKDKQLPPLAEMIFGDFYAWQASHSKLRGYDIGASFLRFLWDKFGVEKMKRYYTGTAAKIAFGTDVPALEKAWREFLAKFPLRPETETLLRYGAGEPVGFEPYLKGLPRDLVGKPTDWTPLIGAAMNAAEESKWRRAGAAITGTNPEAPWAVCELGDDEYGDCVVRATIRTPNFCALSLQLGRKNRAMLVNGTFIYRDDASVAFSKAAEMTPGRRETDFVLVRRGDVLEIWIDGAKVLTGPGVQGPAKVGIGVALGSATFTDVRVRRL